MKDFEDIKKNSKVFKPLFFQNAIQLRIKNDDSPIICIATKDQGWEHVSISIPSKNRCPTWEEMCKVKDVFFNDEEIALQIHPKKSEYVNIHPYCLHLWRSTTRDFIAPPPKLLY